MFSLLKYLVILLLVTILLATGLFLFTLESQPLVDTSSATQVDQAESVKALMHQLQDTVKLRSTKQDITISEDQFNSLVGFVQRAHNQFQGKAIIRSQSSKIFVSYQLPSNPIGQFINVEASLLPAAGVAVEYVKVGPISLSGDFALSSLVTLANWYTSSDIASQFIEQIDNIAMRDKHMVLSVLPLQQFLKNLNAIKQGVGGEKDEELRLKTAFYLKEISEFSIAKRYTPQSLAKYIGPVFSLAKERSSSDESAALENKAAIMALAIYVGHHRFANLVGDVQPNSPRVVSPNSRTVLKSRVDLNQHFIFSAAIKIFSEQGISVAIGEFKELMDRSHDGSGYSFIDLAADFSGIKFAESATNPDSALYVQDILAGNLDEKAFFPNITGLPEGLKKAEFERRFIRVDSPKYKQMIAKINARIDALQIHNQPN
ncbi:hypothetical protein [Paraglaciecola marina]|uniref:hypothetical protein n=1 Tax=Paraglaciecola marina TaxID=2500157 RepID=UPI00105F4A31|nr:hypothetical protein [Paraglaciecola marina]